ncbi:MAG: class I SAM-dependent methyltransferase [Gemmatimonadetes bacterium]|nr:class I SAM-dependent methyltransferase [Gemmatimonadota bacterium]
MTASIKEGSYLPENDGSFKGWWFRSYLRLAYRIWRRALKRFLRGRPSGTRIRLLDCGCGPGFLLRFFEEWFRDVQLIGVDLDRLSLRYAQRQIRAASLIRASVSGGGLPIADRSCDVVVALHVVEHLAEPDAFLRDARRVLAPGGMIMLATPNPAGVGARKMGHRWKGIREDHIALRPPATWRASVEAAGFTVRREGTTGVSGIPLLHRTPLALLHWVPLLIWGFFPWRHGEAYVCLATASEG